MKPKEKLLNISSYFVVFFLFSCSSGDQNFLNREFVRLCTDEPSNQCQQIARDQEVECLQVTSKVDCLLNADRGLPHFALISPEEALLGAALVSDNVVVIAEVVPGHSPYQTAVVVRRSFVGGLENLRGLRYCHPGFKHTEEISKYVLEELESKVISVNCSNDNSTLLEKSIRALAGFFGSSCRPGKWSEDEQLDALLKMRYSSLCDNCGIQGCSVNYQSPFNDTLQTCINSNGGDVALTSLRDAVTFFTNDANVQNFQYLCSDGRLSDPSTPCTWTNQITKVFITSSETAATAQDYIRNKLKTRLVPADDITPYSADADTVEESLAYILSLGRRDRINVTDLISLKAYVEARRKIPSINDAKICNLTVNWSTISEQEQQKCKWLQQAAVNAGLQPVVECIQSIGGDATSSLESIQQGLADIAFTEANYGYIALKKGLTNLAYPETDSRQLSKIVIVVRANNGSQSFTKITDLRSKSGCFPEYGGKEWLAFVDTIRTDQNIKSCDYGQVFSDFIGQSCVPVSNENEYKISITDDKLCGNCIPINNSLPARYCSADDGNKYYSSNGALKCLLDGQGEYAVISVNDVTTNDDLEQQVRVLSRNGSLAAYTGLKVDENAALTVITAGQIVILNGNPKFNDSILLLRDMEVVFGQSLRKPFQVFETFNGTKDLLFPDSTPGLTFGGTRIKYVENFQKLIRTSEQCVIEQNTSGAFNAVPNSTVMLFLIPFVFFINFK